MIQKKYLDLEGLSSYTTKIKNYVASLLTKYAPMDSSAGAWNGIYHRKNLLDEFSLDELSSKIAKEDFSGIPIGSYIETDIKPSVDGAVLALSGNSISGTTAYDISGNANNATMNGGISVSADSDKYFVSADGNDSVSGSISLSGSFTIRTIINPTSVSGKYIFALTDSSYNTVFSFVETSLKYFYNSTTAYEIICPYSLNTVTDIAVTVDFSSNKMIVYKDGIYVGEKSIVKTTNTISLFCFGDYYTNRGWGFYGGFKGCKIYPRALSAEEILQLHNATQDEGLTERVRWLVAGLNNFMNTGDVALTDNHITMVAEDCLKNTAKMNPTGTTEGGFASSEMFAVVLSRLSRNVLLTVGANHFINQRELVSSSVSDTLSSMAGAGLTGASNSWIWVYGNCNLMTEVQLYGATFFSSSYYDVGTGNSQFPLFRLAPYLIEAGRGIDSSALKSFQNVYWLRSVASKNQFCNCNGHKYPSWAGASTSYGIRPYFLFK